MAAFVTLELPPPPVRAVALCAVLALAQPAQTQVLVYSTGSAPAVHGRIDLQSGADTPLAASGIGTYTSDGQFGLRQEGGLLRMWHVPSGAETTLSGDFSPWVAHPRQLAIFGMAAGSPARLDAAWLHVWPVCAPNTFFGMDVSGDGATLVVLCGSDLVSVDATTGAETRRLANAGVGGSFALNQDGTEVTAWRSGATTAELVRLRLSDGQVQASRVVAGGGTPAGVMPAPGRDRAVASACRLVSVNIMCDAVLIEVGGLTDVRALGESAVWRPSVTLSPDGQDAFVSGLGSGAAFTFATWIDVPTGVARASITRALDEGGFALSYLAAPLPPAAPSVAVAAGTVTLAWSLPPASPQVTGYRLEAGFAPGTTAVSIDLGPATTAAIPGVPAGRYFVRLRAVNVNGASPPSTEVVVDVP